VKARDKAILITGAGGYLGSRMAAHLLALGKQPVILWLHADNRSELGKKSRLLLKSLGPVADGAEVRGGDLLAAEPFADVDASKVGAIVHCAAVTRFNVEENVARSINVEGAVKLYEFATGCNNLKQIGLLSSIYACGLGDGVIMEKTLSDEPEFSNYYEWSKWESERRLRADFDTLPWRVLRVATIVAENARGSVQQYNAFHNTLKLLFYGLISLIPGDRESPLYFITADFAVNAISNILERGEDKGIYHICHTPDESMTLGNLIETAFARFSMDEDFRERRILKPLFCDEASFRMLADGVGSFGGDVVREGLGSIVPFAPQLFSTKSFDNRRLKETMDHYAAPDARELVSNACDYLASTRWGRRIDNAA